MNKRIILSVSLLFTFFNSNAQIRVGIESNSQYYVDDAKIKLDDVDAKDRFRSNNYIKLDYSKKYFEVGLQLEGYLPKAILNYSPELQKFNVGTVYARYNNYDKGIDVTLGHFYEQFGSGLVLRTWEDRALGLNNAIFGARVKYRINEVAQFTFLGGKQRIGMGFDLSGGTIYGVNADVDISEILNEDDYSLKFGASFVGRYEDNTDIKIDVPKTTDMFSTRLDYVGEKLSLGLEYDYKTKDAMVIREIPDKLKPEYSLPGNALLLNLGYTDTGFGFNANLRRMQNMTFYSERLLNGNVYNAGTINYIPALTKQYDYALQNIFVYQAQPKYGNFNVDKLGEIGGQFDLFYEVPEETFFGGKHGANFIINGSYWAGLKTKEGNDGNLEADFFAFGNKYYRDFAVEYRRKWNEKWQSIFMVLNQDYNRRLVEETAGEILATTLTGEATYFLKETKSLKLELQHQWADGYRKNWVGGTLEYSPNSNFSFFVHDIYNYGNEDVDMRIHYYSFGGSYSKGATRLAMTYGRQRGGLMCVGGVCRMVPEAAGFTLNITTNF